MEVNPPNYLANGCTSAQMDRLDTVICGEGVIHNSGSDLWVEPGPGLGVNIQAGRGWVQGDTLEWQGMYFVFNDANVELPLQPADPTDDRIDLVVARVYDADVIGGDDRWALEVITGDPSPAPVPPSLPDSALPLAEVTVQAGDTTGAQLVVNNSDDRYATICGSLLGNAWQATEIGPGANLNDYTNPGLFVQSHNADIPSGSNYPPVKDAGLLKIYRSTPETGANMVWQEYTTYRVDQWTTWKRGWYFLAPGDGWGPWFYADGPGVWHSGGLSITSNMADYGAVTGAPAGNYGVNDRGCLSARFTYNGPTVVATADANFSDIQLGTINSVPHRPPRELYFPITKSGLFTVWGRLNPNGELTLTHASFPGQELANGTELQFTVDWGAT